MDATPLGTLTDLAIIRLADGEISERGDHLVVRMPANPGYYWGNYIQVLDAGRVNDASHWQGVFERELPYARHRTFGLPVEPDPDAWAGFTCEAFETLSSDAAPHPAPCPDGYASRPMTERDWDAVAAYELAENARTGEHDEALYAPFIAARVASDKALEASACARFFGAFDEVGALVAHLGVVVCPPTLGRTGLARYAHVGTALAHRRRGLAAHLVGLAGAWAAEHGALTWVICTETTNAAGRVYRRAGFRPGHRRLWRRAGTSASGLNLPRG
jgi:GNAT superfamily N-acetyltransferase